MTAIALTETGIRTVKRALIDRFPKDKSAHLTEALACACGYQSQAALLAAMKASDVTDPDYVLLDEKPFLRRLEEIAPRAMTSNDRCLNFEYLPYAELTEIIATKSSRFDSIRYDKSARRRAWRNAMVATINEGISRRLFTVRPGDNRWPGTPSDFHGGKPGYVFEFSVGDIPALGYVGDAGYDELSIHVAFWPTAEGRHWVESANAGFLAGELYASGWLERRDGAWLQVSSSGSKSLSFQCRNGRVDQVAGLGVHPKGYADRGNFKL